MSLGLALLDERAPCFSKAEIDGLWPEHDDRDLAALAGVLRSTHWCRLKTGQWGEGPTGEFERAFADFLGSPHFLAVANGTVAIELAFAALGLRPGDDVLVQVGTYFGTVTPILKGGARPVFVELSPETLCIDLDNLESRLTERSVGVIVAHLSGLCPDMDALRALCDRHGLWLVEDCAQAIGTTWKGRRLGTFGEFGTFSFQQDKPLNSGEGGGVACGDARLFGELFAHHQGFSVPGAPPFERHRLSTNGRISAFQGALLGSQMKKLDSQIARRLAMREAFAALAEPDDALVPARPLPGVDRWSIYSLPFHFRPEAAGGLTRDDLLEVLRAEGVPVFEGHVEPIYLRPLYRDNPDLPQLNPGCPVTEELARERYLSIMQWFLLGPTAWAAEVVRVVREAVARAEAVREARAALKPA